MSGMGDAISGHPIRWIVWGENLKRILGILALFALVTPAFAQTSLSSLFQKPGAIGDSLSQGFFGVTVEQKTQDWAYPVLVSKQAGSNLSYNVLKGPYVNLEDVLKGDCGPICIASAIIGGNGSTVALPTHAGITGADYTDALYKSGQCQDIRATKQVKDWYWATWYWYTYRWITVADCQEPDKFFRFGLRDAGTQIQIMEKVRPTFAFAAVGANHVLCTALGTSLACLDEPRFKRDVAESFRRLKAMGSLKGGVIFSVPDVTTIAYLERWNDPSGRANYSGLKPFYRGTVSSPDQVLDAGEIATVQKFLAMENTELRNQATGANFAFTDAKALFDDIKANGRVLKSSSGYSPGNGQAMWPLPGRPGLFGLDGVHPNRYGHSIMANELILAINKQYGVAIPKVDEYSAWYYDSLNRSPVDLKNFLTNSIFGQVITWIVDTFM